MKDKPIVFDSSVAQNYDDLLGAFMFEPFALDLLERSRIASVENVLELACGTGRVTKHLSDLLPSKASLTATDINPGMIAVAKSRVPSAEVKWETADISKLPYDDNTFDLIVCQFGIMFVPDKVKALEEIYRVLQPGGRVIFNTWGPISNNKAWQISNLVVNSFLGKEPTAIFNEGPFCMNDEKTVLHQLEVAGFKNKKAVSVRKYSEIENASVAAKGFIIGLPTLNLINDRIPHLLPDVIEKLEEKLSMDLGDKPLRTSFQAWVFEAVK
ncbi:methyltransferase domain-containing protein [Flavobacterium sp. LC2016-01]|uniref:class I SAM-dependent methyltransferase n=1 Tax=Flavobacterium sp. LC2016-01 TaxID=2675876 RepID=UPI0012BA9636|nr:methyltransferase domain-containing protein [Flavobacterium sp. LC2016-01]MTH15835.1 methyltransferase domain-containing protein [Flavobacterium sp. LC2016-01]